ncbi:VOC family protein [Lacibacter luteus]|uniref:VOC family protein n=1 Tax=Lacibacter luteus TaxID=2508719 RepID=A0A4V1M822_9BACT|nr:VOC family protein [Lacibacter luteus]RXK62342.1 VOC family protein [Lacibacter luteus]
MPATLNPYLSFEGNCAEAMQFYQQCFGGELNIQKVKEAPIAAQMPPQIQEQVMHAQLNSGAIVIMGSDMNRTKLNNGNGTHLCVQCTSEEEAHRFFNHLAIDGSIIEPLARMFWGGLYGSLTDKYGKYWLFNFEESTQA